ncbi:MULTISPECIES: type I 3-dehydroquinate dehydratase [Persephonella]|uniref:3-dehydroquinate dehydratase n=1 Tax=Persephonella marina (strain DSM 14350 / EX-H1) TaxID=123214 RepID=C0QTU9_PERMH|nr:MULTISPECIES: type I 3-dehydroquinate dehydratase [Persephonella]ACO03546.1 3-dehydroquinate dehydratase, type I [Persephonella marina EX-H1]
MEIGKYPLIALPLDDRDLESKLSQAKSKGIDLIELRIDMFSSTQSDYVKDISRKVKDSGFGIIGTVRSVEEGGLKDLKDSERIELFEAVSDYADIIDIELRSERLHEDLVKLCRDKEKFLLVSYHDFEKTPSEDEIQEIIDRSSFGDIIKFAFMVKDVEDVGRILSVTHKNRDKKIVSIGMGDLGKITRVAGFFFGSLITYTYIGESVAPGQIEVKELIKELKFYGLRS